MDRAHAASVLAKELDTFRAKTYTQLRELVGSSYAYDVPNPGGHPYQVEIQVSWDFKPGGAIRVLGGIDDGGWSAFVPIADDILVIPQTSPTGD